MNEAPLHMWLAGPLPAGVEDILTRLRHTEGVTHLAVMPDVHVAAEFCVGTVVASDTFLFPNAVGGDIGCGMLALGFDSTGEELADPDVAARLLGQFQETCPARRHHRRTAHELPAELRDRALSDSRLDGQKLGEDCRTQLGTLGAGNHFLELQRDQATGMLWLMLHTGSRHLGQCVHHHHLPKARRLPGNIMALPADSPEGRAYLHDVQITRAWARENRRLLALAAAGAVERLLHTAPLLDTLFDCDHNHLEASAGLFLHRKGATAAGLNEPGLIPGSMGTQSFHTLGKGCPAALNSSSHGAGRALSRTQARDRITRSALRQQLRAVWYDARLEPHLLEEAPAAYKPVEDVMRAQAELTTITRRLKPVLVHKGI
jgi:tRNA-splicing ligase RtcB (3'-phosphate/5'-hydroxy nucleic acid ligase)